jgi:pectinesterase
MTNAKYFLIFLLALSLTFCKSTSDKDKVVKKDEVKKDVVKKEEVKKEAVKKTFISDLLVNDSLTASSWKVKSNIQTGNVQYGDRGYTIANLPDALAGSDWIITAADSKKYFDPVLATFKINADADVFIAYDNRVTSKPEWISGWEKTTLTFQSSGANPDAVYEVFKKSFKSGSTVSLGSNGQSAGCINYMVIVKNLGAGK